MAASQTVPELGGYDYEFTVTVPDRCECLVCHLPMKDPVQIVGCGHRLCNICMESLLRRPSPLCPADREPLSRDKIFPDSAHRREIMDLTVKCPHFGCSWTGELRAVEKHQSECLLKEVQCSNSGCTERLTKEDMIVHESSECSWRKINCEHCQESFVFHEKRDHLEDCQKLPVQCTNKCGLTAIPREKLEVHIRDECLETEVHCEYRNFGCDAMFPRSNTSLHSTSHVERHLSLALHCFDTNRLQVNNLVSLVKEQSQQIEQLVAQVKEQSQERERLVAQVTEESQQRERLEAQVKELSQQTEQLVAQVKKESQQSEPLAAEAGRRFRRPTASFSKVWGGSQQSEPWDFSRPPPY
ncbi:TNF receptor-associated factor 5 [Pocillopora verrucosa]|uniref:TNF receptor-associated factor 5 n=1 Tax=Pocillopora verrucosa TaxID=203993 RepID=UPI003341CE77